MKVNFPCPLPASEIVTLMKNPELNFAARMAVALAWTFAQRISDTLQWRVGEITSEAHAIVITVYRGKTITTTGPYCLFLPHAHPLATGLRCLLQTASPQARVFPCSDKDISKCLPEEYERRSIRRGGAEELARGGATMEQLRLFTQHTSDKTALRYIRYGAVSKVFAEQQMTALALGAVLPRLHGGTSSVEPPARPPKQKRQRTVSFAKT